MRSYSNLHVFAGPNGLFSVVGLILAIITSCSPKRQSATDVKTYAAFPESIPLSSFFSTRQSIIPLETIDSVLIADIDKVIAQEGIVAIGDFHSGQITCFSADDGKYLTCLNRLGRGPQEYMEISDFDIYKSSIFILSRSQNTILEYAINGDYVQSFNLSSGYYSRLKVQDSDYLWLYSAEGSDSGFDYARYSLREQTICKEYWPFERKSSVFFAKSPSFIGTCDGGIAVSRPYDNHLYLVSESGISTICRYDFGEDLPVENKDLRLNLNELHEKYKRESSFRYFSNLCLSNDILLVNAVVYLRNKGFRDVILETNMNNSKTKSCLLNEIQDDTFPEIGSAIIASMDSSTVTMIYDASYIMRFKDADWSSALVDVSEDDNPVLIVYKRTHDNARLEDISSANYKL